MSDSTKTILWIALAVVVILVIVAVVMSSRRRRVLDERRFKAGELRAEAHEKAPLLQERADRASVTEQIAADARAEADEKEAAAAALEDQAHAQRAAADGVKAERDDLAREADRIDPDVATDDEGHRVDQPGDHPDDHSDPDSRPEPDPASEQEAAEPVERDQGAPAASVSGAQTTENTGVLGGASTLDDHDDEPDLADAADPFATAGEEAAADGYDEDMKKKKRDTAKSETPGSTAVSADATAAEAVGEPEADAVEPLASDDGPEVATATQPTEVSVPALNERDDVLVGGGPPDNDPGDHRGQPWATTPGEPGLDEGDEVADNTDEGFAAHTPSEAAPESGSTESGSDAESDGNSESGSDAEAAATQTPAPGESTASATADSDDDAPESPVAATDESADVSAGESVADEPIEDADDADDADSDEASHEEAPTSAERRISGFDEVFDGGYGIGSAQPIDDGAQPLAHPVKAWTDRKSFAAPGDEGYDGAEPDVWFYNEDAARRAGFGREGG